MATNASPVSLPGRRFLLHRPGKAPFHAAIPCYLMSQAEAAEAVAYWRAVYGQRMDVMDTGLCTCEGNYPGNGSQCELPHGHDGDCCYVESKGERVTWAQEVRS